VEMHGTFRTESCTTITSCVEVRVEFQLFVHSFVNFLFSSFQSTKLAG